MSAPLPVFDQLSPIEPPAGFAAAAANIGVEFEGDELRRLGLYLAALLEANKTTNLTAIRDPAEAWTRHVLDSLTLLGPLSDLPEGSRVIDVGSGGGLPGVPLAIAMPGLGFTLLEATGKKADFLRAVVAWLGLGNVCIVQERAERAAHDRGGKVAGSGGARSGGHREAYDAVVARAVGRLHTLAELTLPFAKAPAEGRAGLVLLIKGQKADEELAEAAGALHTLKAVHVGTIDTPTGRIVVLEKGAATPKIYPRADGEPMRVPLGAVRPESSKPRTPRPSPTPTPTPTPNPARGPRPSGPRSTPRPGSSGRGPGARSRGGR